MDRSYLREERIVVYPNQEAKSKGLYGRLAHLVPYSRHGLDYYRFQNQTFAGYIDPHGDGLVDGCIILDQPLKGCLE